MRKSLYLSLALALAAGCTGLDSFKAADEAKTGAASSEYTFNGYTNHWQSVYQNQYRYGNLYRINVADVEKTILQSKRDLAEKMGIPGLQVQEGFFAGIMESDPAVLVNPSEKDIKEALKSNKSVLVYAAKSSEAGEKLAGKSPLKPAGIGSYQTKAEGYQTLDAFALKNGGKTIYAVVGCENEAIILKSIIEGAQTVLSQFDMKRGWFGTGTNIQTVGVSPGTPIDVIGRGSNEGNSWYVFSGGYETHSGNKIANWVAETGLPIVTDLGASPLYGCTDWDDFQSQLMNGRDSWFQLKARKGGYIFRNVGAPKGELDRTNPDDYDGYFAQVGHEKQINATDKPFVITTGYLLGGTTNSMVLFTNKDEEFTKETMWKAIMSRHSVAVGENGTVMGSDIFRQSIQLMMLDREYIEDYFGDKVNAETCVEGTKVTISLTNLSKKAIKGELKLMLPSQIEVNGTPQTSVSIPAGATKQIVLDLNPSAEAMGRLNAVAAVFDWGKSSKQIMAKLDMPPAVSTHQLLYGSAQGTEFPVSIYNFTNGHHVDVSVSVAKVEEPETPIYQTEFCTEIEKGSALTEKVNLELPAGSYIVSTEAMGVTAKTQLGIGGEKGTVKVTAVDLNGDGVDEYIMENSQVKVTLLTTGARVIEYIVKSKNDNVLFKLWPEKPADVNRPFREWAFWPFGGFEDFLGQASMETHKVYDAEIVKAEGDYAEVKMTGRYYGNVIEKTFSLYGDTPLLGIRFALDLINDELDVLGPQPIVSLGKAHGPEDKFVIPETVGINEYRMDPKRMWGKILDLKEGWNAGEDTIEKVSFVGAYPVNRPFYLHMWMNLDTNPDSHYPYCELQPWVPLYHNNTSYFSYYMWADGASWEKGVAELRSRNLITER